MSRSGEYSNVEYVFEPHSTALPDLREYVAALWERRVFIVALAKSDLRSLRSNTSLGNIWGVLDPIFQAGIYYFIYSVMRRGSAQVDFLPVLIANLFLFGLSTAALSDGGSSIKRAKGLVLNSTFPRALMPITSVYRALRKFVPMACVLAVLHPLVGGSMGAGFFVLPLLFGLQIVMNVGISLLVATFVTLVSDGANIIGWVSRLLFFLTPIIYPISLLPGSARAFIGWQPLFPLFASYQAVFSGDVPSPGLILQTALWALALLVIGGRVFLRHEREFTMHL